MTRPAGFAVALVAPDETAMHEVEKAAEAAGYILVTDGKVIQLALPHAIPPGFTRFAFQDKNARRLAPKAPRA